MLRLGDVGVCVPAVALTSMLPPCCGRRVCGGGKGGVLKLVDEPYGNERL